MQAARDLFAHGHWSWCCFTCKQTGEKVLKALGEHFWHSLVGHNLNLLVQAIQAYLDVSDVPDKVRRACARLNRYYIPTRYPNAFDQFFETDAQEALSDAETILQFARNIVESP